MLRTPIYNPGQLSPDELERLFVVRRGELAMLRRHLADFASERGRQHLYVIGRRGMGKTTLLLRLVHMCRREDDLDGLWPAPLLEEQYGIGDLADFWMEVACSAAATLPAPQLEAAVESLRETLATDGEKLAEAVLATLKREMRLAGRKLVIFIDNLDDVLEAVSDELEQHRLREELQENDEILVVAASARAAEATFKYKSAFYEFFRVHTLQPLDLDGVRTLLVEDPSPQVRERVERTLAGNPARLHGVLRLTGGNPRLVTLCRRLMRDMPLGGVRTDLEQLLDDVTPYYKHLIEEIPRQARRVFHAVAGRWEPVKAADIEVELRLKRSLIAAQLSRLHSDGWLESVDGVPGRGTAYQLASRLFNLYYVMRFKRTERERLRYWVLFVEAFYGVERGHRAVVPFGAAAALQTGDGRRRSLREGLDAARCMRDEGARRKAGASMQSAALRAGLSKEFEEILAGLPELKAAEIQGSVPGRYAALSRRILEAEPPGEGFDPADFQQKLCGSLELPLSDKERVVASWLEGGEAPLQELLATLREEDSRMAERYGSAWPLMTSAVAAGRLGEEAEDASYFWALWDEVGGVGDTATEDALLLGLLAGGAPALIELDEADADWLARRFVPLPPESTDLGTDGWAELGRLLHRELDQPDEAEQAYLRATAADPEDSWAWLQLGRLREFVQEDFEGAEAALRAGVRAEPNDTEIQGELGRFLWVRGGQMRLGEAEEALRRSLELDPNRAETWLLLGDVLCDWPNRQSEAESAARRSVELDPDEDRAWWTLAQLLLSRDAYEEAEAAARQAIRLRPADGWFWITLGDVLAAQPGREEEAVGAARKAAEVAPELSWAWTDLAYRLLEVGQAQAAEEAARRATEAGPGNPWTWHTLGSIQEGHGRAPEAQASFKRAVAAEPDSSVFWRRLADLRRSGLDDPEGAAEAYQQVVRLEATTGDLWALGSILGYQLDRPEEAIAAYRAALDLEPDALSRTSLAQALLTLDGSSEALAEASDLITRAGSEEPDEPDHRGVWARVLLRLDRPEEALAQIAEFVRLADEDYLTEYGRDGVNLALEVAAAGHSGQLARLLEASPVPDFWAPVRIALLVRSTGDAVHFTSVPQEIADMAWEFLERLDEAQSA